MVRALAADLGDGRASLLLRRFDGAGGPAPPRVVPGVVRDVLLTFDAALDAYSTFGYTYCHLKHDETPRCASTAPGADLDSFRPCAVDDLDACVAGGPVRFPRVFPRNAARGAWAATRLAVAELAVVAAAPLARQAPHASSPHAPPMPPAQRL